MDRRERVTTGLIGLVLVIIVSLFVALVWGSSDQWARTVWFLFGLYVIQLISWIYGRFFRC